MFLLTLTALSSDWLHAQKLCAQDKTMRKADGPVPEWAQFFTADQYDEFMKLVEGYFQEKQMEVTISDGTVFPGKNEQGFSLQFGLDNLAQVCRTEAVASWKGIVTNHFDKMLQSQAGDSSLEEKIKSYPDISPLLSVRVYPSDYPHVGMVNRVDLAGTFSTLVFDLPTVTRTVNQEEATPWGKDVQELFDVALSNLLRNYPPQVSREDLVDGITLTVLGGDDVFVASHSLHLDKFPGCVGTYGSLVAIPHRHIVLCYPIEDEKVARALVMLIPIVKGMFTEGPGSISSSLYWYHEKRFTLLPYETKEGKIDLNLPEEFKRLLDRLRQSKPL